MEEKAKFDQSKYNNEFKKENYAEMRYLVPKNKKALLQKIAKERGWSLSRLVVEALEIVYRVDLSKDAPDDQ